MSNNFYTTKTAALKATKGDIRNLNAKQIKLKDKNILEYIEESVPTITHSQNTRETVYEDDLWGQWVETKDDGTVVVHDDYLTNPNVNTTWDSSIKAIQDNKAYSEITYDSEGNFSGALESSVIANIQTERIKDGSGMFSYSSFKSFIGDLSSLVNGSEMFCLSPLESFSRDSSGSPMNLSSLTTGHWMFMGTNLTSFSGDLSNLTNGYYMFRECANLTSFNSYLDSLVTSYDMFAACPNLTSFSGDLSRLVNGSGMFRKTSLKSFTSDLSSLVYGSDMFYECKLTPQSVIYIVESITNITEEKAKYTSGKIPWVTYDSETQKYSAPFGFMEDGQYAFTYNNPQPYTITIHASGVGQLTLGINVTNDANTIQQQLEDFAKEAYFDSWAELKQEFVDKGWTVTFQYGGTGTSITYGLRDGEQIIPCPIFAKLVEADKDSAEYCTEDASVFYNIEWGHDVTDTTSYTQFNSIEDAMTSWNVFPKENIITTEE